MPDYKQNIIDVFKALWLFYEIKDDTYRIKAYRDAINALRSYTKPIRNKDEIPKLPGIGKRSIEKIKRIIDGETIKDFIPKKELKLLNAYGQLIKIRDVGQKKAITWINKYNVKSLNDLKKKIKRGKIVLTDSQKLGLKYYKDLNTKIPHKEIQHIEKLLKKIIKKIDPLLKLEILGSYRRKLPFSSDIDILIYHPKIKTKAQLNNARPYIKKIVNTLDNLGLIAANMKIGSLDKKSKRSISLEYLFKTKYSKFKRKVDLKFYPYESYPTALMYFTGSRNFNRRVRERFKRVGYLLADHGLYKKLPSGGMIRIPVKTEKDIFKKAKMDYIQPSNRI